MSRIVDGKLVPVPPEKWADLPIHRLHPFAQSVRLVMDASIRLATLLDQNDKEELDREFSPSRSCFLGNLMVLLRIEYTPEEHLLSIMQELKECLGHLKASFRKRYRPEKSKFVVGEINRLINEICDNPRFDNILLQKDIYRYFCDFFKALNVKPQASAIGIESANDSPLSDRANQLLVANANLARPQEIHKTQTSATNGSKGVTVVSLSAQSTEAIGKSVAKHLKARKKRAHSLPATAVVARDSLRDKKKKDNDDVVREINKRWRHGDGSRSAIIKKMKTEARWKVKMTLSNDSYERYAKGYSSN